MQKKPGKKTIKNQNVGFLKAEKPGKMIIKNPNVRFFSDIMTNKDEKLLGSKSKKTIRKNIQKMLKKCPLFQFFFAISENFGKLHQKHYKHRTKIN